MTEKFNNETINKLADSLLFSITEEETKSVIEDLEFIEDKMNIIWNIKDINKVEPQTHPFDLYETSLREDNNYEESTDIDLLLSNAKMHQNREIEVPRVVAE